MRPREQLRGGPAEALWKGLRSWERESNRVGTGAQGAGNTAQDLALPLGHAEARRAQDSKDTPAPS